MSKSLTAWRVWVLMVAGLGLWAGGAVAAPKVDTSGPTQLIETSASLKPLESLAVVALA